MGMKGLPICDKYREAELLALINDLHTEILSPEKVDEVAQKITSIYDINEACLYVPYGAISGSITTIFAAHGKDHLEQLSHNLDSIVSVLLKRINDETSGSTQNQYIQAYRSILTLRDYVSMETNRADQMERQIRKAVGRTNMTLEQANALNEMTQQISTDAAATLESAKALGEEAKDLKTEVVTILTVFAAIILAFSGGLTILGEAVAAIASAPLYQILLVALVCIGGLFNTVFLLLNVVAHISGKGLSMDCKKGDCKTCDEKGKCKGFGRFRRRSPYVFGFNLLLYLTITGVIILNSYSLLG